ncbi:MAG: UDP-N-acetylglucosamine 2-epimerase (non-hydrolyzing) [bacterium]|nr:UDP-N-acetylglucosamine 2-epimerase (non-hydrolyzing) [bacterium]
MKTLKILTVVGARPQFIKAAALSKAISVTEGVEEILVHTGQHFDQNMSDIFFKEMGLPKPHYQLNVNGLNHGAMTGRMMEGIEDILVKEQPDVLLVYGDTNSTLAGALAAKKLHIKVAHVEAGLRSFNMKMPEEVNRILTDRMSDFLFCPTQTAIENLKKEGYDNFESIIVNTGDIMLDSLLLFSEFAEQMALKVKEMANVPFVLCTIHRAENTDDSTRLNAIFEALNKIANEKKIIIPLHPRTKQKLDNIKLHPNILLTDPLGYFDMLYLIQHCDLVMTDSGGLQKEAFFNKKFCITLRDETEWIELVGANCNYLTGANSDLIYSTYKALSSQPFIETKAFYGNGTTAFKILEIIMHSLVD